MKHKVIVLRRDLLPYSETFIREQVRACRRWHAVLAGFENVNSLPLDGLDICLLRHQGKTFADKVIRKLQRMMWRGMKSAGIAPPDIVAKLRKQNPELIHMHFGCDAVELYPLMSSMNVPVAVTLHGYDINIYPDWWEKSPDSYNRDYPRQLAELAGKPNVHFIAVSDAIRQTAIARGIPADKIEVKYIGVDTARFRPGPPLAQRPLRILYTGRMVEKKGPLLLIEAFARLQKDMPEAELVMIGDGPLLEAVQQKARDLKLNATFTGSLPSDQVKVFMDTARIFCLPSITADNGDAEGLPIVVLEAQACGVPVVTSARGAVTEGMLDGETGFVFPEKDVDALADRLLRLLKNETLAAAMAAKAPQFIAGKFDLEKCTAALEDYYDRIVQVDG